VTRDLRSLLGGELRSVRAPSQIWTRGRFVDFPPTPLNAASSYGLRGAARIGLELLKAKWRPHAGDSFEDFAHNRFGPTLARSLLLNYSEKLWGLPAAQLSPDVATRRLHGMTLRSLFTEMLMPRRRASHIDGKFLYPRLGYGEIAERLAASLPREALKLSREVVRFELREGAISRIHFKDASAVDVNGRVVSTLPVTLLVKFLGDAAAAPARDAAARLRFRRIRLLFLRLDQSTVSANASIYIPESRFCVSRVYEPKNRSAEMAPEHETALLAEIPCFPGDALDGLPDKELAARVIDELSQIGLVRPARVLEWEHFLLPFAYPVYTIGYQGELRRINAALSEISNLDTIGRAGAFCYSHLHDQLRFAKDYVATLSA
jgi:protoporphyrinogen oxidase